MQLKDAFWQMINTRSIYKKIGISCAYQQVIKSDIRKKKTYPKEHHMRELLILAGYINSEETWQPPKD